MIVTHMPRKCNKCGKTLGRKHIIIIDDIKVTVCFECKHKEEILSVKS